MLRRPTDRDKKRYEGETIAGGDGCKLGTAWSGKSSKICGGQSYSWRVQLEEGEPR